METGGELTVHNFPDMLGEVLKSSRIRADAAIEEVAEKAGITSRYLYRIENEGQKPAYDVLCRLIRIVSAPVEQIFYPESADSDPEIEELVHMLYRCDRRSLKVIRATLQALLEDQKADDNEENTEPAAIE